MARAQALGNARCFRWPIGQEPRQTITWKSFQIAPLKHVSNTSIDCPPYWLGLINDAFLELLLPDAPRGETSGLAVELSREHDCNLSKAGVSPFPGVQASALLLPNGVVDLDFSIHNPTPRAIPGRSWKKVHVTAGGKQHLTNLQV
ncbi:hypothetical protein NMY22_g18808 [Coprinellus aureogranulatus]|nr:hypothetical protein NMY22_g18808 [Coprinellus aureogranulatus]